MKNYPRQSGFTLVELLIVIIIITIIAALLIPAVNASRATARRARVALEMTQIASAFEAYRNKAGDDYPSDFSDLQLPIAAPPAPQRNFDTVAHLARAFPRHDRAAVNTWLNTNYAAGTMQDPRRLDPAEAIVFWLGLVRNDHRHPVCSPAGGIVPLTVGTGRTPYFTFDPTRLRDRDNDGWPEYYPPGIDDAPYVYFDHSTYLIGAYPSPPPAAGVASPIGVARPYQTAGGTFLEPNKYQISTAGFDNNFGVDTLVNAPNQFKQVPTPTFIEGVNIGPLDRDNMASFSEGKTIEAMRP